jgi:hypothetical protein
LVEPGSDDAVNFPVDPIGTRVIDSTPAAMTTSWVPDNTACAANWIDCCDEPPVDRNGRDAVGQTRRQHGVAADVKALLAALAHAAHDHVVDRRGIDPAALDDRVEHGSTEVDGMPARKRAAAPPAGRAHRFDDIGFRHQQVLLPNILAHKFVR